MATSSLMPTQTSTFRSIPFSIATNAWTLSNNKYTATFSSNYITKISKEIVLFDETLERSSSCILIDKAQNGGGLIFTVETIPDGTITGIIYSIDRDDGKIPILLENTVIPISSGGTGASDADGARSNLGIDTILSQKIGNLTNLSTTNQTNMVSAINEINTKINNTLNTCTNLIGNAHKVFTDIEVPVNAWSLNAWYNRFFQYAATISLTGIDENYFCDVILNLDDMLSGNFSPICESTSSGLMIWCKNIPNSVLTIPIIKCTKML